MELKLIFNKKPLKLFILQKRLLHFWKRKKNVGLCVFLNMFPFRGCFCLKSQTDGLFPDSSSCFPQPIMLEPSDPHINTNYGSGTGGKEDSQAAMREQMFVLVLLLMMRSVKSNFVNRHDQIASNLTGSFITQWQVSSCYGVLICSTQLH